MPPAAERSTADEPTPTAADAPATDRAAEDAPATDRAAEDAPATDLATEATEPTAADAPAAVPAGEAADDAPETSAVVPAPRAATHDADLVETTPALVADPAGAPSPATVESTDPAPAAAQPAADDTGPADDFRRIQGIGPKMANALQAAGIRTYRQLADLDEAALRETIRAAGLRAAASLATWPQQAKVLAGAPAEAERVLPVGADTDA
nr:helix-hairpin-helix domain-containing protein [Micromonospora sp. PLK6-60]